MDIKGDLGSHVPLPPKVDEILQIICAEQNQQPASPHVRRQLVTLGEEEALNLLKKIRGQPIKKNLNACIQYFIKNYRTGGSASPSPAKVVAYKPDRSRQSCATNLNFNVQGWRFFLLLLVIQLSSFTKVFTVASVN